MGLDALVPLASGGALEGWLLVVHEPRPGFFWSCRAAVPDVGVALMAGLSEEHDSGGCEFKWLPLRRSRSHRGAERTSGPRKQPIDSGSPPRTGPRGAPLGRTRFTR